MSVSVRGFLRHLVRRSGRWLSVGVQRGILRVQFRLHAEYDVDLPGPLDFAVGLGLDIALDPLTYMAGAGLLARGAKAADVANGLRKGAKAAEAA